MKDLKLIKKLGNRKEYYIILKDGLLEYNTDRAGKQEILWDSEYEKPELESPGIVDYFIEEMNDFFKVTIKVKLKSKIVLKTHNKN